MPVAASAGGSSFLGPLAASAAGALLGGSGSQQHSTTSTTAPWAAQQPYLRGLFSDAQNAYNNGQLAQANPLISQAANAYTSGATNPNGLVSQAQNQLGQTIGGQYLSPSSNPYLSGAVQQALDQVKQNVNSQFRGDNFGSSANQEFLAKTLANTALPIYAQNYQTERQNQLNALTAAPGLQAANADQLAQAGQLQQTQLDLPYLGLQRYGGLISGNYGSETKTPYFTNPGAQAVGGALGGLGIYNALNKGGLFGGGFGGADVGGYAPGSPY